MNKKIKINKTNVMTSTFIIPLAVPIFLSLLFLTEGSGPLGGGFGDFLVLIGIGMLYGAIFYIPTIIAAIMIEAVVIQTKSTQLSVVVALVIEGLGAFIIIASMLEFSYDPYMILTLGLSITIPQLLRWFYLKRKNRMFTEVPKIEVDSDLVDDIEIEDNV